MSKYQVKMYSGDYKARQLAANADNAILYVEQHLNSSGIGSTTADYAMCVVASNASQRSIDFGRLYAKKINNEFQEITRVGGDNGIVKGGRGDGNLKSTNMPAVILEPMFTDDPAHARVFKSPEGQARLALVLVDCIKEKFPNGGIIALSIGHIGKTSAPNDRGASVVGGGTEAQYSALILEKAKSILEGI